MINLPRFLAGACFIAGVTLSPLFAADPAPDAALADALHRSIEQDGLAATQKRFAAGDFAALPRDEAKLNHLGYDYLSANKVAEAVAVLKWATELYPTSGNAFDSYGEALVKQGDRDAAIAAYEKAVSLNPQNGNAKALLAELKSSPDAIALMQERMKLEDELNRADENYEAGRPFDFEALRQHVYAYVEKTPKADSNVELVLNFLYVAEAVDLTRAIADWKHFEASPNAKVKELAESKHGLAEALQKPLELKFTAIDGREVDLAKLRGKVVLVDFWATWCGPCVHEIPNVVANYQKYHDQGFEIVGITFDQAPDPAHPSRRQKTAEQVAAFTQAHHMPWPQYYDGLYWKNKFGQQYGIRGIPAMFLVDRQGMIVSTNCRGTHLGPKIQELLAKQP